ncbi:MAG: hypothetical protein ACLQDY_26900 [Streptosporangiaceae bacterium]
MNAARDARGLRASPYVTDELFVAMHRSATGLAWRWRTELAFLSCLSAALWRLALLLTLTAAALILTAAVVLVLAVPGSRRFTIRRAWCVLARHRLQKLCWEARLHTRAGRLPLILAARPTKVGERLWVCCRAGVSAEDFENRTEHIRAACWARDARITRHPRWSQLVRVDVIRRDTLAPAHQVTSPLVTLTHPGAAPADPPARRPAWPAAPSRTVRRPAP